MKPENYTIIFRFHFNFLSSFKLEKQKEIVIDRNGTRTFQDGQEELGLQTTNLKNLG